VVDAPLGADDPRYVSLAEARGEDVVELLARGIEFSGGESVQFLSGLPGTGKTTELRRLKRHLEAKGYTVDHKDDVQDELWTFKDYVESSPALPKSSVVIIDAWETERSFGEVLDALPLPGVHLVYTAPFTSKFDDGRNRELQRFGFISTIPSVCVVDGHGRAARGGLEALKTLVRKRFDSRRVFDSESAFELVLEKSGGNLRDLLRLLAEIIRRAALFPVGIDAVREIIKLVESLYSPIPTKVMTSLSRVAQTHELPLEEESIAELSRWADGRLILQYRNGREWYDVHPLIRDIVLEKAHAQAPPPEAPDSPRADAPGQQRLVAEPVKLTPEMRVTILVENFRALRKVRWEIPRGVSALVGPNGSGKTTLLDIPDLLRHAIERDVSKALNVRGGPGNLRNVLAEKNAPLVLGVSLDDLTWQLELSPKGAFASPLEGERASHGAAVAFDRRIPILSLSLPAGDVPLLERFVDLPAGAAFAPLLSWLKSFHLYKSYDIDSIRRSGSQTSSDQRLDSDGRNVFSVLRNWRDRKETRPRWDFVMGTLHVAFPETFHDLEFETAGQTVTGRIVTPTPDFGFSTFHSAHGLLVALLHLTAVASTEPAGAIAIDEMENGLHPHAIRQLIEAMREWASTNGISVVLATHSPVVLDQFKDEPENLFVMEPGRDIVPARLDEIHDPHWLAHFSLGDLYAHDEFGAQNKDVERIA